MGSRAAAAILFSAGVLATLVAGGCGDGGKSAVTVTVRAKSPASGPATFTALVGRVKTGILRIETDTCNGRFIGTGFLIGPRLVATVEHVVDGAYMITLKQNGAVARLRIRRRTRLGR